MRKHVYYSGPLFCSFLGGIVWKRQLVLKRQLFQSQQGKLAKRNACFDHSRLVA